MREVLRDQVDLARALQLEELRLAHDVIERERAMPAAHERDRAERAAVVAAFADLEVADVRQVARVEPDAGMHQRRRVVEQSARRDFADQPVGFAGAEEEVDFGEGLAEFVGVAFDHAAHGGDHAAIA